MHNVQSLRMASVIAAATSSILIATAGTGVAGVGQVHTPVGHSAPAKPGPDAAQSFLNALKDYAPASEEVKAKALALIKDRITQNQLVTHLPPGAHLTGGGAKASVGPQGTFVAIPITGAGLSAPSALVVQIGEDDSIHTSEFQFTATGADSGVGTSWHDGALSQHLAATNSGTVTTSSAPVPAATPAATLRLADWWDDFSNCMTAHGVPGWVMTIIGAACTLAGVTVACALGVAAFYADAILACIGA